MVHAFHYDANYKSTNGGNTPKDRGAQPIFGSAVAFEPKRQAATICNHPQPSATICNHLQPSATIRNHPQPSATIRNQGSVQRQLPI
jgi:hypothetical protein